MRDNKIRLSTDVLEKASQIAAEWGLKNSRAAVEAVFRRYADEYRYGRYIPGQTASIPLNSTHLPEPVTAQVAIRSPSWPSHPHPSALPSHQDEGSLQLPRADSSCEALDALDELLGA